MHVFQIKGFTGLVVAVLSIVAVLAVVLLGPAAFFMVLWNALVFEGLRGPEIDLLQGFLLWGAVMVAIKMIFQPEIKLQFQQPPANKNALKAFTPPEQKEDSPVAQLTEVAPTPENQN
jgi:hypothetical protein